MARRDQFLLLDRRTAWQVPLLRDGALQPAPPRTDGVAAGDSLHLERLPGKGRPLVDGAGTFGGLTRPTALALDKAGNVYAIDGDSQRIVWFDPCNCTFHPLPALGGEGRAPRRFREATAIAISRRNDLYVVDGGNRRIQIFALKGTPLRAIWGPLRIRFQDGAWRAEPVCEEPGAGDRFPDGTWLPYDIALHPDGHAYVSDAENGLVHRFDRWGR